jgi:hypothetical protein
VSVVQRQYSIVLNLNCFKEERMRREEYKSPRKIPLRHNAFRMHRRSHEHQVELTPCIAGVGRGSTVGSGSQRGLV